MITIPDIAYVRSGVEDLDGAVDFATRIVGLTQVPTDEPGVAHLRADDRVHCLTFVQGPSGAIATGLRVGGLDELADAETQLEKLGITVTRGDEAGAASRGCGAFIGFDDPWGNRVELVARQFVTADLLSPGRNAGITEFGHSCFDAPDVIAAGKFWTTVFSAKVSDWVGDKACLLRVDPMHHKLAVFYGERPALCHVNFQVASHDDLFRNWHFLVDNGVEIIQGPGRHPTSGSAFVYFRGPENLTYEYAVGTRLIHDDDAWTPRVFDASLESSIDMWRGPIAPTVRQMQL
ncbi:VOC family protein [Tsukamurella spumae]|uniref:Glyoxalase n=1 Tax=Tsukamurella spumae TaxID=44753 RepID=A0A846X6D5_9ACTN|nr:VOC family protein [Tsukamurella spumae]NKY19772.1 glyoxalase [Tsukamurella spumae]